MRRTFVAAGVGAQEEGLLEFAGGIYMIDAARKLTPTGPFVKHPLFSAYLLAMGATAVIHSLDRLSAQIFKAQESVTERIAGKDFDRNLRRALIGAAVLTGFVNTKKFRDLKRYWP